MGQIANEFVMKGLKYIGARLAEKKKEKENKKKEALTEASKQKNEASKEEK